MFESLCFTPKALYHHLLTPAGPFFKEEDYPDLTGQKWMVTGATGGIGLELSKILVRQNAELWIVGRSVTKLDAAEATLKKLKAGVVIHKVVIDYNDLTTVKPAVEKVKAETDSFKGIIHNAGVMNVPRGSKTKQGFEQTVGVNNLATQLLQDLLDPLVENVPNARVIWLSSLAHMSAPKSGFDPKLVENGGSVELYAMSKAMDYIQAVQWTRKHPNANVKSIAVHPGIIKSDLTRTTGQLGVKFANMLSYDTPYGALAPIYAALSPDAVNNDYIIPFGRPGPVRKDVREAAHDERGAETLSWIEKQIQQYK